MTDIKLVQRKDWYSWLQMIRGKASTYRVWKAISPDISDEEVQPVVYNPPSMDHKLFKIPAHERTAEQEEAVENHKALAKIRRNQYAEQLRGLQVILGLILETLGREHHQFIQDYEPEQVREVLKILKRRFLPSLRVEKNAIMQSWAKLMKGPPKNMDVPTWLDKCHTTCLKGKEFEVEVFKNEYADGPIWDLLHAISTIDNAWATTVQLRSEDQDEFTPISQRLTIRWIVERFSDHYSIKSQTARLRGNFYGFQASFRGEHENEEAGKGKESSKKSEKGSTTGGENGTQKSSGDNGARTPCKICGQTGHDYKRCFYLCQDIRPHKWAGKKGVKQKLKTMLKDDPELQLIKKEHLPKNKDDGTSVSEGNKTYAATTDGKNDEDEIGSVAAVGTVEPIATQKLESLASSVAGIDLNKPVREFVSNSGSRKGLRALKDSFILDSGTNAHVVNDKRRFISFAPLDLSISGLGGGTKITGVGEVYVYPTEKSRCRRIKVTDVAYVPDSPLNLISFSRIQRNGLQWWPKYGTLTKEINGVDKVLCDIPEIGGLYMLEHHLNGAAFPAAKVGTEVVVSDTGKTAIRPDGKKVDIRPADEKKRSTQEPRSRAPMSLWHLRLGHPSREVLVHASKANEGVEFSQEPAQQPCEACAISEAPRQISRRPVYPGDRPWQVVWFDITFFEPAYNGDTCLIHFYCMASGDHAGFTLRSKGEASKTISKFHSFLIRQGFVPQKYHTDGEKSLGKSFFDHVESEGLKVELTVPDTPEQNGPSERAGGVIVKIARVLRITARLPEDLWPLAVQHAIYLLKRLPSRRLGWKTPFEIVTGQQPNAGSLKVFGCRAYRRIEHIPRKQKLEPRAEIGYLVGFEDVNIYLIWHPGRAGSRRPKIVRARDVTFDETRFFDPNQPVIALETDLIQSSDDVKLTDVPTAVPKSQVEREAVQDPQESESEEEDIMDRQDREMKRKREEAREDVREQDSFSEEVRDQNESGKDTLEPSTPKTPETPKMEIESGKERLPTPGLTPDSSRSPEMKEINERPYVSPVPQSSRHDGPQPEVPAHRYVPYRIQETDRENDITLYDQELVERFELQEQHRAQARDDQYRSDQLKRDIQNYRENHALQTNEKEIDLNPGSRKRKEGYHGILDQDPESLTGFRFAFGVALAFASQDNKPQGKCQDLPKAPANWKEVLKLPEPHRSKFIQAAKNEYRMIREKGTWKEVQRPKNVRVLPLKWVFTYKFNKEGVLLKYKARLCVRGDLQVDLDDTYAATLSAKVIRLLLALAAVFGYMTNQRDVVNAFLNSLLDQTVYVEFPEGMGGTRGCVLYSFFAA